ncbi:MAG: hypothetical protein FWD81_02765 [Methanomassiliicoccaceae archaeon]|nr:hypothetical protein [Methanomassiliicoccaceae archaeon]
MKFENRKTEFPGRRRIKVLKDNGDIDNEVLAYIVKEEGIVTASGTPITADNLNLGNWRDDDSISFKQQADNLLPSPEEGETQIVTDTNGETWVIPPAESGRVAIKVSDVTGTIIRINGNVQQNTDFTDDPQTQITNAKNIADAANNAATTAMGTANGKSAVNVNGVRTDVNFTSDPQTQINGRASTSHAAAHVTGTDQIALGNGTTRGLSLNDYNATDKSKVNNVPANTNTSLNGKLDKIQSTGNARDVLMLDANRNIVPTALNGGISRNGGTVQMNLTTDRGRTVLFISDVNTMLITGSPAPPGASEYVDDEARYIFKTGSSQVTPLYISGTIEFIFPEPPLFKANSWYMVAIFGRVLTWSEGVKI